MNKQFAASLFSIFLISNVNTTHAQDTTWTAEDSLALHLKIENIVTEAIDSAAFPGCQIFVSKRGKTIINESFGHHTYDNSTSVQNSDLYDLASITKTTATTLAIMKLYEEGKINLDTTMGAYFPELRKTNKAELTIRKVLAHQSRLKNWIPFYQLSQKRNGKYKRKSMSKDSSARFPDAVPGSELFLHKDYRERVIYKMIAKSDLYDEERYVYSGLSFYLFPKLIEQTSGMPFEQYLQDTFYTPLGATSLGFKPLERFDKTRIVPTEVDSFFRMSTFHGVVHDEGAAVMLGVSGNAGLFSTATDLAKIYQMLLNNGTINGHTYLRESTIKTFTSYQFPESGNRRGLGFDKPLLTYDSLKSSVAKQASPSSYGHTGYTGTLVWADPEEELLFIFLSNRVHPSRLNKKIYQLNVRPRIHDLIYELTTSP